MMSIKKKRRTSNSKHIDYANTPIALRQQIKELIDIIGYREDHIYRDGCLDDICKVLERYIDMQIKNWQQAFEHHEQKEEEWKDKVNFDLSDIHHSMKIYSNGAAHALQFFKDELLVEK